MKLKKRPKGKQILLGRPTWNQSIFLKFGLKMANLATLIRVSNMRHVRAFCEARDAFWEFSNNQHICCQVHWKKTPQNNWIKPEWYLVGFRLGRSNTDHISISSKILVNLESMLKTSAHALSTSTKHTTGFLVKLWGLLRECGVDGRLFVAAKSLYSCSDVCVRVTTVHHWCWTPTRVCAVTVPFHS